MGDDTLVNFNVAAFQWGRETYTRLGVDSNGYVIVGGGTAEDNQSVPQALPDSARPNNVVAPWWTDLNLASPGCTAATQCGARIAILASAWWVRRQRLLAGRGLGERADGRVHRRGAPPRSPALVRDQWRRSPGRGRLGRVRRRRDRERGRTQSGAENRRGSSGVNTPTPSDNQEYVVATSGPGPGGSVVLTYEPRGRAALRADGADDLEPDRGDDLGEREPPRRPVAPRWRLGRFAAGPPVGGRA